MNFEKLRNRVKNNTTIDENGCWIWHKAKHRNGYGATSLCTNGIKRFIVAHRLSFIAFNEYEPFGLDVCHKCDVRACCNPDHLFSGSRKENIQDCIAKGRFCKGEWKKNISKRGESHHFSKLTDKDVMEIKWLSQFWMAAAEISNLYNCCRENIYHIKNGRSWTHVE